MLKRLSIITLALTSLAAAKSPPQYWYFPVKSPYTSQVLYVGPYPNLAQCRDMYGSAIYAHPWACHTGAGPTSVTCRILGNGFVYPKNWPYPATGKNSLVFDDCVESNDPSLRKPPGWYIFYYTPSWSELVVNYNFTKTQAQARKIKGAEFGYYRDTACPGAPFFSIGFNTACN